LVRAVLAQRLGSPLQLDATPHNNRTRAAPLGAQNASVVDFSTDLLHGPVQQPAYNSSPLSLLGYGHEVSFALLVAPAGVAAALDALAAAAHNATLAPTQSPTLSGVRRLQLRAAITNSSSSRRPSDSSNSNSSSRSSSSSSSSSGRTLSSKSGSRSLSGSSGSPALAAVGGGLPAWRFSRVDAVDALRFTVIDELGSAPLAAALNVALAPDGVAVAVGPSSIAVAQVTRGPTLPPTQVPSPPPSLPPTRAPTQPPVLAPSPLPSQVPSAPPTPAPHPAPTPAADRPLSVVGAALGGALLLLVLSGVGIWLARQRGYCGGDPAKRRVGKGVKPLDGDDEAVIHLAKKRRTRRASLETAQVALPPPPPTHTHTEPCRCRCGLSPFFFFARVLACFRAFALSLFFLCLLWGGDLT
jgi:hypothetical protein